MEIADKNESEDISSRVSFWQRAKKCAQKNLLVLCLLFALVAGVSLGAGLRNVTPALSRRQIMYVRFPGDVLMNMLTFLIVPLIITSLVSGLASLDARSSGKMGLRAVVYYLTTTIAAVILGIIVTIIIQPGARGGNYPENPDVTSEANRVNTVDTLLDLIRQCFPDNILEMCFLKPVTQQIPVMENSSLDLAREAEDPANNSSSSPTYEAVVTKTDGMNVLGMVVFSVFLGLVLARMGQRARPLAQQFEILCEATMQLVKLAICYSPIGITCLIAAMVVEMEDPGETIQQLMYYFLTVVTGLAIHALCTLPLIYLCVVRRNPFWYILGMMGPLVTALATSSSSATMPVTMQCLEENQGIDKRVVKFVIPVGATINMDGTALYEAVAVLFIGQRRGLDMDIGRIITISLTATAAAIGAAGVPQAGLVTMVIVLSAVGFPADDVALILTVDWLLDRFRTVVNVLGDAVGAGIVYHLSRNELETDILEQEVLVTHEEREPLLNDVTSVRKYDGTDNSAYTQDL